jgi:hypothetical protein
MDETLKWYQQEQEIWSQIPGGIYTMQDSSHLTGITLLQKKKTKNIVCCMVSVTASVV